MVKDYFNNYCEPELEAARTYFQDNPQYMIEIPQELFSQRIVRRMGETLEVIVESTESMKKGIESLGAEKQ